MCRRNTVRYHSTNNTGFEVQKADSMYCASMPTILVRYSEINQCMNAFKCTMVQSKDML